MRKFYAITLTILLIFSGILASNNMNNTNNPSNHLETINNYEEIQTNTYSPLTLDEHNELTNGLNKLLEFFEFAKNTQTDPMFKKNKFTDGIICDACHSIQGRIHDFLLQKYGLKYLFAFGKLICSIFTDYKVCSGALDNFGNIIYDGIVNHYFDTEYICTLFYACTNHFIRLNADDYAREVLKDKPVNLTMPSVNVNATTWKVLHVSDIHTDEEYTQGTLGLCDEPLCCRKLNGNGTTVQNSAGKWGFAGPCDIPMVKIIY